MQQMTWKSIPKLTISCAEHKQALIMLALNWFTRKCKFGNSFKCARIQANKDIRNHHNTNQFRSHHQMRDTVWHSVSWEETLVLRRLHPQRK